jgi:hypothetical protein
MNACDIIVKLSFHRGLDKCLTIGLILAYLINFYISSFIIFMAYIAWKNPYFSLDLKIMVIEFHSIF